MSVNNFLIELNCQTKKQKQKKQTKKQKEKRFLPNLFKNLVQNLSRRLKRPADITILKSCQTSKLKCIPPTWFGLVWFYSISAIVGYLCQIYFYAYNQFYFTQYSFV